MTAPSWRYARPEREVRFLLAECPPLPVEHRVLQVHDRYLHGTRLRTRRVTEPGREPVLKLGQKVRVDPRSAAHVAHTSLYLDQSEHDALAALAGDDLHKTRHLVPLRDLTVAVDVFSGRLAGLVTAEIDLGAGAGLPPGPLPLGLDGAVDVSADDRFTGGRLAATDSVQLHRLLEEVLWQPRHRKRGPAPVTKAR